MVGPEKRNIMDEVINKKPSNILFNYMDGKAVTDEYKEQIKRQHKKLFIDSGAFSAWTKGRQVDTDEYVDWLNDRVDYIDLFGQVDIIPGDIVNGATKEQVNDAAEGTWQNYLYMRDRVINKDALLYTFHVGEPSEFLQRALEWRDENGKPIPYIALGGMVRKPMPVKRQFLADCFSIIRKSSNPNVKVHAFGMTSTDLLEEFPIESADSTSWILTAATGNIITSFGIVAVSEKMSVKQEHYSYLPEHLQREFKNSISRYGFTLDELRHSRDNRIIYNARFLVDRAQKLRHRPGPRAKRLI